MGAGGKGEVANTEDISEVRWSSDMVWLYAIHSGAMLKIGWGGMREAGRTVGKLGWWHLRC